MTKYSLPFECNLDECSFFLESGDMFTFVNRVVSSDTYICLDHNSTGSYTCKVTAFLKKKN